MKFDYLMSSMSPLSAVILASADRHVAGIPVEAEYFAYLYPVAELDHLRPEQFERLKTMEPRAQLLIYGGLSILTGVLTSSRLLPSLAPARISFDGPYPLLRRRSSSCNHSVGYRASPSTFCLIWARLVWLGQSG